MNYVPQTEQARTMALLWTDWRMKKDVRKRRNLAAHADTKLRIQCLRKNDVLPREIRVSMVYRTISFILGTSC